MVGALCLRAVYWVTSYLRLLALSVLTCSPEYELPSSTFFGQLMNFGKI